MTSTHLRVQYIANVVLLYYPDCARNCNYNAGRGQFALVRVRLCQLKSQRTGAEILQALCQALWSPVNVVALMFPHNMIQSELAT